MTKPIERARQYVQDQILAPVLDNEDLPESLRNKVKNEEGWLNQFERVGDLYQYISRFTTKRKALFTELKENGLLGYQDVEQSFRNQFKYWTTDVTQLDDFVTGKAYAASQILIPAGRYNYQEGGIMPIKEDGVIVAIVIKATLKGNKYPNEWLNQGTQLKYYFKSQVRKDAKAGTEEEIFKESFYENKAILENPELPIYTFVRKTPEHHFIFKGVFYYHEHHSEDNKMWFILDRTINDDATPIVDADYLQTELSQRIRESEKDSSTARQSRLVKANKKPKEITIQTKGYERNADVITEVLKRAGKNCERCKKEAPFIRRKDNTPYLEVHHKKLLSQGGDDTVENAIALCPNCHRELHYGAGHENN